MNEIPKELLDTVCHTTTVESFLSICESGYIFINPDPSILKHKKFGNAQDENNQTYVQNLGGVSVFDFKNFSIEAYNRYLNNTWEALSPELYRFLPNHNRNQQDGFSVWMIIDTTKCKTYINRESLYRQWQTAQIKGLKFIPKVEAAILSDISIE